MAHDYARPFYDSKAWQDCKVSFIANRIAIDGGMCQVCHEQVGYIVHHKIEITPENINDNSVTLNHNNLLYVCHECHNKIHGVFQSSRRIVFDENGNVFEKI